MKFDWMNLQSPVTEDFPQPPWLRDAIRPAYERGILPRWFTKQERPASQPRSQLRGSGGDYQRRGSVACKSEARVSFASTRARNRVYRCHHRSCSPSTLTRTSAMPLFYPSILFQERVLGFAMGGLVGMGVFMFEQREVWRSTVGLAETLSGGHLPPSRGVQVPPPILGKEARDDLAHVWNSTMDKMFGSLIASLSSKGW